MMLSRDDIEFLGALPLTTTPLEHLYRYTLTPEAPDDHLRHEIAPVREEYVLLGHTHFPMVRRIGPQFMVNPAASASHATGTRARAMPSSRTASRRSGGPRTTSGGPSATSPRSTCPGTSPAAWPRS
jgi:hypothetical protein